MALQAHTTQAKGEVPMTSPCNGTLGDDPCTATGTLGAVHWRRGSAPWTEVDIPCGHFGGVRNEVKLSTREQLRRIEAASDRGRRS